MLRKGISMKISDLKKNAMLILVVTSFVAMIFAPMVNASVFSLNKSVVEKDKKQDVLSSIKIGDIKQTFEKYVDEVEKAGISTKEVRLKIAKTFNTLYEHGIRDDDPLQKLVSLVESGALALPGLFQLNVLCKITSFCLVGVEFDITLFTTGMVWFGASLTKSYDSQVPIIPDQISLSLIGIVIGFNGDFDVYWSFPLGAIELKGWHMDGDTILVFAI